MAVLPNRITITVMPEPEPVPASEPAHGPSNPPRVVVYGETSALEICLHNPLGIAGKISPQVLAAFFKCFMGVERVLTFEHLMYLNHEASQSPTLTDGHSFTRNHMVLAMLLAGTMYEVGDALQDLCSARVAEDPSMRDSWGPLDKVRAQWYKHDYASKIRNNFSHHLGEREKYAEGLEKLIANTGQDPVVLYETDGGRRYTGRYRVTWDVLFQAHDIQDEQMKPFVKRTQEAHNDLPDLVFNFFREVLDARGVPVIHDPRPRKK